jgi:hypothetical protein
MLMPVEVSHGLMVGDQVPQTEHKKPNHRAFIAWGQWRESGVDDSILYF